MVGPAKMWVWVAAILCANAAVVGVALISMNRGVHKVPQVDATVRATSSVGNAPPASNTAAQAAPYQPLTIPQDFVVTNYSSSSVSLSWKPSKGDVVKYDILRGKTPNAKKAFPVGTTTATSFTDTSVEQNITYYYWVKAESTSRTEMTQHPVMVRTYMSWQAIHARYQDSVVKIQNYRTPLGIFGQYVEGTGWFVKGGYVVTNWHVIHNWNIIHVYLHNDGGKAYHGQHYSARVVASSKKYDLAILKLYAKGWSGKPLPLGPSVSSNDAVAELGHPGAEALTMTTGTVLQTGVTEPVKPVGTIKNLVRTSIPSVGGNSGSPVFDHYGAVVGIMESGDAHNGNISYFVPVQYLSSLGIKVK